MCFCLLGTCNLHLQILFTRIGNSYILYATLDLYLVSHLLAKGSSSKSSTASLSGSPILDLYLVSHLLAKGLSSKFSTASLSGSPFSKALVIPALLKPLLMMSGWDLMWSWEDTNHLHPSFLISYMHRSMLTAPLNFLMAALLPFSAAYLPFGAHCSSVKCAYAFLFCPRGWTSDCWCRSSSRTASFTCFMVTSLIPISLAVGSTDPEGLKYLKSTIHTCKYTSYYH